MKKFLSFIFSIVLFSYSYSQKCKYKVNDIDKFTNQYTKITKPEKVISTFYTKGDFSVKKVDTSFSFIFDYELSSYSNFDPYSIKKSASLIFLLENGEVVTLISADDIKGTKNSLWVASCLCMLSIKCKLSTYENPN